MSSPSNMEVDPPPTHNNKQEEERKIAVHPLAIVNMSDQYTRITCGGSPMETTAPVVGLLFGLCTSSSSSSSTPSASSKFRSGGVGVASVSTAAAVETAAGGTRKLQIRDADDIPVDSSDAAARQVSLHRAVFPQHSVVGWYRVTARDDQPTESDLILTRKLQRHYRSVAEEGEGGVGGSDDFVFALLQVPSAKAANARSISGDPSAAAAAKDDNEDDDDPLPLTLYECSPESSGGVLVALEDWTLETSNPERVAVERVVREKPSKPSSRRDGTAAAPASVDDGDEGGQKKPAATAAAVVTSPYMDRCVQIQHSVRAIQERVAVLKRFLVDTAAGTIPTNHGLLRQVRALLYHLGPIAAAAAVVGGDEDGIAGDHEQQQSPPMALQQLAVLAKTVDAIQSYAEKFRVVRETPSHHHRGMGRERRGFVRDLDL